MAAHKVIVEKIIVETHNVKTYHLKLKDPSAKFDFKPGQFLMLAVPCEKDGKKEILKRAYSIASSPLDGCIRLAIKKQGVVTGELDKYKGGEELEISGPFGHFLFSEGMGKSVLGIAAGVGLAPIWSIIRFIHQQKLAVKTSLLFSNMTPHDLVYQRELEAEIKAYPDFKVVQSITRPHESSPAELKEWTGKTGRIDKAMIKEMMDSMKPDLVYICGRPEMAADCQKHLVELGMDPTKIKMEKF